MTKLQKDKTDSFAEVQNWGGEGNYDVALTRGTCEVQLLKHTTLNLNLSSGPDS